ncbi:RNA polymerase sigma factor [Sciscionella sediminilitoris]|uniref:RNA polymerase sigma factor n=1 Tax=Sciscionella sediminilitoris TaxID=1445613 RepID=UPI0004DFCA63|nr:sigma-70 family RNA polymerase sigma factor [Sciscionella sp. SE31]
MTGRRETGDLLRSLAPRVLGALLRRYGDFEAAEDAVQEALLAAARSWPDTGLPEQPEAWLIRVAARRLVDEVRSEAASRAREQRYTALETPVTAQPADAAQPEDTLTLLLLCCHQSLDPPAQIALTLRAVGGLSTTEIARAFLVPETTMGQRISRAKKRIKAAGARFVRPCGAERAQRLRSVLHVLYLVFNEGYTASSGDRLRRGELTEEAIRLARLVRELLTGDGEATGLLALMLLLDARRSARVDADGGLVPLAEQDRSRWDRVAIEEGSALLTEALSSAPVGPYQLQAAIAAVHAEAPDWQRTDWSQIVRLYELLAALEPNPMVTLNQAVAVAMDQGPDAGLALLEPLDSDARTAGHHRLHAVRAHLLELAGDLARARDCYRKAASLTTSVPEQRYLTGRADRLG